jgi:hypothetical protein
MKVTDEMFKSALSAYQSSDYAHSMELALCMAILAALDAMPKQEPVCYVDQPSERLIDWNTELFHFSFELPEEGTPLYTHPQPKRNPLSDDEKAKIIIEANGGDYEILDDYELSIIDAIEKAHGIGV